MEEDFVAGIKLHPVAPYIRHMVTHWLGEREEGNQKSLADLGNIFSIFDKLTSKLKQIHPSHGHTLAGGEEGGNH